MADNNKSTQKNISEQSIRSLSASVGSLAMQVKSLSASTARAGMGAARGTVGAVGGAVGDTFGVSASKSIGLGVASAINPFVGEVARRLVERNRGALSAGVRGMIGTTKNMVSAIRNRTNENQQTVINNAAGPASGNKRRSGRRLTPNSFTNMYGSADEVEALDRLRISNADWLKAVFTKSKDELKRKPLPKANVGGYVRQTGQAIVHEGEAIVPAEAIAGQYAVLRDMRDMMETQNETLMSVGTALGAGNKTLGENIAETLQGLLKNHPLLQTATGVGSAIMGFLVSSWKFKALAGPGAKYSRLVERKTPLETIATATSLIFGDLRHTLPVITSQLNKIITLWGGEAVDAGSYAESEEFFGGKGVMANIKRAFVTGNPMELFRGAGDKLKGTKVGQSVTGMVGSAKAKFANIEETAAGNAQHIRSLAETDPVGAAQLKSSTGIWRRMKQLVGIEKVEDRRDKIDHRDETHYQKKHLEWMRNNGGKAKEGVKDAAGKILGISKNVIGKIGMTLGPVALGILSALGIYGGAFALGGKEGIHSAALGFGPGAKLLGKSKVYQSMIERLKGTKSVSRGLKMLSKTGKAGKFLLKTLNITSKAVGSVAWPLLIITTIIDGVMGWFKAKEIFGKDATLQQKISSMLAGVVDGIIDLVRFPINLLMKALGREERFGELIGPIAKYFDWVFTNMTPFVKQAWKNTKTYFRLIKNFINLMIDIVQFPIKFLQDPKKAIEGMSGRIKDLLVTFVRDVPNRIFESLGKVVDHVLMMWDHLKDFAKWVGPKLLDFAQTAWGTIKSVLGETFSFMATLFLNIGKALARNLVRAANTLVAGVMLSIVEKIPNKGPGKTIRNAILKYVPQDTFAKKGIAGKDLLSQSYRDHIKKNPEGLIAFTQKTITADAREILKEGSGTAANIDKLASGDISPLYNPEGEKSAEQITADMRARVDKAAKQRAEAETAAAKANKKSSLDLMKHFQQLTGMMASTQIQQNNQNSSNTNITNNNQIPQNNPHMKVGGGSKAGSGMK